MENLWSDSEAQSFADDNVTGLRVYTSQLLGRNPDLVLHGGGNTSVKGQRQNIFGETEQVLFVKGSGWDLRTIQAAGFAPVKLDYLRALGALPALTDTQMMQHLRSALLDPAAPTPSVEAILHALIPHAYVDHTHADAVVTLSNTPNGEALLRELYGDRVLILPYVMPGFILAQQVHQATRDIDWQALQGIVLLHHGIISFAEEARTSYDNMITLVTEAESCLQSLLAKTQKALRKPEKADSNTAYVPVEDDFLRVATLRNAAAKVFGKPILVNWQTDATSTAFANLDDIADIVSRGPLTPDHSIHTKPFAAVFRRDPAIDLKAFRDAYQSYFAQHAKPHHQCLDLLPRVAAWQGKGMLYLAPSQKRLRIVADIYQHTLQAIQVAEALGGWTALPKQDQFDLEYWELEQAKLKSNQSSPEFEGKVVLVTGAASGIGKACVETFCKAGACVVALDINPAVSTLFTSGQVLGLCCDITDDNSVTTAVHTTISTFGGLDVLLSNAGFFPASQTIDQMSDALWEQSLNLNLSAHMRLLRICTPYLRHGLDPCVIMIGSKNVPAPGPGAAAYSVAKAGQVQLARVAALELAGAGIRVNTIHPNAVFDTGLWTPDVLAARAASYGLSVDAYKRNTLLKTEVSSADVAAMALSMAGRSFARTTGAQVPVDGGNDRVI